VSTSRNKLGSLTTRVAEEASLWPQQKGLSPKQMANNCLICNKALFADPTVSSGLWGERIEAK